MLLKKRTEDRKNWSRGFGLAVIMVAVLAAAFSGCSGNEPPKIPSPPDAWTAVAGAPFEETTIQKVSFGDNTFVATGNGGSAWYSADGISWTTASDKIALGTNNLSGLTFGNGKFLTTGGSSGNTVRAYSDDQGDTWKESGIGFNCKGLIFANNLFLAGGASGQIAYSENPADGSSWRTLAAEETTFTFDQEGKSNGFINSITFGDGKFVAAGSNYGHAAYSTDGTTWTGITQTEEIFAGWINGIAYGNGQFVAVGDGGKAAYASSSSVDNWTMVVDTKLTGNISGIAYGNGHFVAVDNSGSAAWSSDGVTWTVIADTTFGSDAINGVTYGSGKFVIVGAKGRAAYALVD